MAYTTIDNPELYFQTKIYTGDGNTGRSITFDNTDTSMQPDFAWFKNRDDSDHFGLVDSVRGVTKRLSSNAVNFAEQDQPNNVSAFNSNGFSISASGIDNMTNTSGEKYVFWCWKAGGSASSNSDGSITSSVSANTTAGFSIVSYTGNNTAGATVGHGLSTAPSMVILKNRNLSNNRNWVIYHTGLTSASYYIYLNSNAGQAGTYASFWNNTAPSSSVFTLGSGDTTSNGSSDTYVAYCFSNVQGYQKIGSYTGNGNADAPFIYTGFKPAMVILKETTSSGQWYIFDNKRDTFNLMTDALFPDLGYAETTDNAIDFYSNGFKGRKTSSDLNTSGNNHIYIAFAESPFTNSSGVPNNAR